MDFFKWKDAYSVRNSLIDSQHKEIIRMLNSLNNAFLNKQESKITGLIINDLVEYTKVHFKTEEDFFKGVDYKFETEHIAEHNLFITQIAEFKGKYESNNSALTFQIMNFLRKWLMSHIQDSDQKYVDSFEKAGINNTIKAIF